MVGAGRVTIREAAALYGPSHGKGRNALPARQSEAVPADEERGALRLPAGALDDALTGHGDQSGRRGDLHHLRPEPMRYGHHRADQRGGRQ